MTEKLYYKDAYIHDFTACVVSCCPTNSEHFTVILDKTAFFPEAGGQKADTGSIGIARVIDVREDAENIVHITDCPLPVGASLSCSLNWRERFEKMQSHSGEHIVSGIVHNEFGFDNVGFHLEDSCVTFDFNGKISDSDILRIEALANDIIFEDRPINAYFPSPDSLANMKYRSKLELTHDVRIVEIEGLDLCACCAPHVSGTAQIGLVKMLNWFPHRGGTRIEMVCGRRAVRDYGLLHSQNGKIMGLLSSKRFETATNVSDMKDSLGTMRSEIRGLKNELAVAKATVERLDDLLCVFTSGADYDGLRACINSFKGDAEYIIAFSENDDGVIYACESASSPIKPFAARINSLLAGRGGGKDNYAQGKIGLPKEQIVDVLRNSGI